MYVVSRTPVSYVDAAGVTRLYDLDNIGGGGLAGGGTGSCGCAHRSVLEGALPETPTGKAALVVGSVAVVVGGVVLYRRLKGRR